MQAKIPTPHIMLNIDDRLISETAAKIKPNALAVLLAIAIHLNHKTGRAFPSNERLQKLTGLGRDAVTAALAVLRKNKLLESSQILGKGGKFGRREFRVTTRFISIFIHAEDAEPLTENPYAVEPSTVDPGTENTGTELTNEERNILTTKELINKREQTAGNFPQQPNTFPVEDQKNKNSPSIGPGPLRVTIIEGHEDIIGHEDPFDNLTSEQLADMAARQSKDISKVRRGYKGQNEKKPRETKPKEPTDGVIQAMVTAFEYEHRQHFKDMGGEWIGFTWQGKEFPALASIRKELEKRYKQKMNADPAPENIIDSWALFLRKAATCDKFILENCFTPSKIWSQFQSIVNKIYGTNSVIKKQGSPNGFGGDMSKYSEPQKF